MRRTISVVGALLAATTLGGCCETWLAGLTDQCDEFQVTLKATPSTITAGESVRFEGGARNVRRSVEEFAWDFDGDHKPDRRDRKGAPPLYPIVPNPSIAQVPYPNPGTYRVGFMVLSDDWDLRTASTHVEVLPPPGEEPPPEEEPQPNQPPTAMIEGPSEVQTGQPTEFHGRNSSDPDGSVVRYRWDFENDGQIDFDGGSSPTAAPTYGTPGQKTMRLVVDDDDGATGEVTKTIFVQGSAESRLRVAAAPRAFTATLRGRPLGPAPPLRRRGEIGTRRGLGAGRLRVRLGAPRRPGDHRLRNLLGGRWRTRLTARFDRQTLVGRLDGIALTRPVRQARRGERGCVRFALRVPAFGTPTGVIRLLGGTRRYKRLRVRAGFTPTVASGAALKLAGTVAVRRASRRGPPKRCLKLERQIQKRA